MSDTPKLSSLTPEQKTRLLAELDGWTWQQGKPMLIGGANPQSSWKGWIGKGQFRKQLPSYLTSYDAIIPLVQKLWSTQGEDADFGIKFLQSLYKIRGCSSFGYFELFISTTSQLCDAVLVATGKAEV